MNTVDVKGPEPRPEEEGNGALKIGELPHLHIVDLDQVVLHEDPDMERVARLVDRFSADGILKNPPVVGRSDGHRLIVLDGANRVTALRKLHYPHVLVQELDLFDAGLTVEAWHHAVEHLPPERLLGHVDSVSGVRMTEGADPPLDADDALARFHFADGRTFTMTGGEGLVEKVERLHAITRVYHRFAFFDRVSYTNLDDLARNYRGFTALLSFRRFSRRELQALTAQDRRVPSGITRVLLPKRALRFNLQLEVLRSGLSLEEKEDWLQQTILERVADKAIRFYREPTFFFDE